LATDGSKNLKDNAPKPRLKSNIPPNKKDPRSETKYSISQGRF
tara:strand:+ start:425 stop:553 length:129 start_codon:yes stop_codon:yes gene_type:complete